MLVSLLLTRRLPASRGAFLFTLLILSRGSRGHGGGVRHSELDPAAPVIQLSSAIAINNSGVVIGKRAPRNYTTDLITVWLAGPDDRNQRLLFWIQSYRPEGINENGDIVGYGPDNNSQPHGRFNSVDLGIGYTNAVNNLGQVAGWDVRQLVHSGKTASLTISLRHTGGSEILSINDSGGSRGVLGIPTALTIATVKCAYSRGHYHSLGTGAGASTRRETTS